MARRASQEQSERPDLSHDSPDVDHGNPPVGLRFASEVLADSLTVRALNAPDQWGPSDHCCVEIEIVANFDCSARSAR